jgi:hypothetical protein
MGHLISKTLVEHVTCKDHLKQETQDQITQFNNCLNEQLDDNNFQLDAEDGFRLMDVDNIADLVDGIQREEITTPGLEEYGDMLIDE